MRMAGRILVLFISSISLFVEGYRVVREANSALAVEDPTNKTNETDPADFELPDGIYMLNSTDGCYRDAAQFPPGDRPGRYWRGNDLCWSNLREVLERNSQRREAQRLQNQSTELTAQPGYRLMMGRVYKRFFRENPFHGKPMLYPFDMEWYYTRVLDQWSVAWNWNSTDPSTPFQVRMWDGQNVSEKIFNEKGQWKDWLQMVLESAIAPDGAFDEDCLKCVRTTCSDSDVYMKQQFYLERMESGDVFPILGTGRNGTQPMASQMAGKYHFLGKWMAKAYLLQEDVFAPASFHQLIYDSLVAGEPVKPQTEAHYSEQDTIQECEWLAAISGNRSMPALRTYAWMTSCDQVKDPGTGTYAHQDCYVPLYRDEGMWESLNVTWGLVAPNGSEPSDSVPLDSAREYTQQTCLEVWNRDVVEPVEAIVKGFREMIPAETFWKKLKGASQLKRLIEGSQEVDVDNFLARVVWQGGPWSGADRQVMEEVMRELGKQGSGLPILKQPLSKLLRYITGSSTEPVHAEDEFLGEPLEKIVFVKADTDDGQCHLPQSLKDSHLWVAAPCLIEKALLMEQLHLQIISPSYTKQLGEQTHLLGFDDVLLAGMLAGESRERTYEKQPPVSQGLRGEAQVEFNFTLLLLHDLTFKEDIQVDVEESNASVFQQMLSTLHNSTQWEWDWSKIRIVYSGSNSDLSVSEGRKKEWLQLVLESAVCPSEELLSGPATANGLACLSGECENLTTPQYFLKNLPSGDVVPIHSAGKLSAGAKNHFYVLGKWIARAYIIDPRVFAPLPLHNFIYESLVAGKPTATIGAAHYSKDDTIEECERLVSILGNRRLEDVGPYAWKSCDAVQDADTGKYVQDDCYVPLYRSPDTWKELDIKWGAAAPNGVEPYDSVPYERAREYTEQNCRYLWETGFADPVEEIIKGFREVIPTDKMFWKKLQGASHLKQLVEGSHEVDAESFLARVVWQGPWSEADRQMMEGVMGELHQQGSGLPIQKKPLSKLLRYITGSSRKPVPELDGFVNETSHKIVFVKDGTDDDKCHRPLSVQNNRLWVSEECLTSKALLMEQFDRPLVSPQTGQDIHLLGFMDDFLDAENERRKLKGQPLLDTGLRGLAQRGFDIIDAEWPRLEVNRQGNTSVFQQTQAEFRAVPTRLYVKWGKISFAGEAGVDAGGLKKEWLQLVLETAVLPDANDKSKENLECLRGECENITTVQCFLETLPSGDVVPIMHSGHGKLSAGAKEHFHFIGKWMARAYVIENMVSAPLSFHDLIYKSLIAGTPRPPQVQAVHYSEEDKIKECEWLVAVSGSRRPQEVGSYGWRSCDGVQDPETGKYTEEGCYKPLYRAGDMWEWLYNEWGPAAPDGVEPSDLVPFERAREYTERNCRYLWETDFAEPVQEIIDGFREVVGGKLFWRKLKGESELKELIEGSQEVDLEALLAAAMWDGTWSSSDKDVFKAVLGELRKEGEGKAMLEKPLNRLLRFFTGAYKAPLKGWASAPPKFQKKMKPRCEPLTSHTCFNTLEIPSPCLENKENLTEMMKESIAVQDFGQV